MAKVTTIIDDFNGEEGAETYRAIIDGKIYEIDLTVDNFKKYFREVDTVESIDEALKSAPSKIEVGEISDSEEYTNLHTNDSNEECRSTTAGCPMCGGCTCETSSDESEDLLADEYMEPYFKNALNKVLDKIVKLNPENSCLNSNPVEDESEIEESENEAGDSDWRPISNLSELRDFAYDFFAKNPESSEGVEDSVDEKYERDSDLNDRKYLDELQNHFNELGLPVKVVGFFDKANAVKSKGFETAKQAKDTVKNKVKNHLNNHESEVSEFLKDFKSAKPKLDVTSEVLSAMRREFAADRAMGYSRHSVWTKLLANYGRYKIDKKIAASIERTNENIEAFILAYSQLRGK